MANKIHVGNISSTTTDKDLFDLFSKSGLVASAKVGLGIDQKNTGHGYVTMGDDKDVEKAILKFNNAALKGNKIRVAWAHSIDQNQTYFSNQNRYRRFSR